MKKKYISYLICISIILTLFQNVVFADIGMEPIEIINIPDKNLENAIRSNLWWLGKEDPLTIEDLESVFQLEFKNATDLTGLEYCTNLTRLGISDSSVSDLSPLANLSNLNGLGLKGMNNLQDLSFLENNNLTSLVEINLNELDNLTDISALSNLTSLDRIGLFDLNNLSDLSVLEAFDFPDGISISNMPITDLSFLKNKTLGSINISNIPCWDFSVLETVKINNSIFISETNLSNLSFLRNIDHTLSSIYLRYNKIQDITALNELTVIPTNYFDLIDNQITDVSPIATLLALGSGQTIYLSDNYISDFSSINTYPNYTACVRADSQKTDKPEVAFYDSKLETFIRNELNKIGIPNALDKDITISDMEIFSNRLHLPNNLVSLEGLQYATNIKQLILESRFLDDINQLSPLVNLNSLHLTTPRVKNLNPISTLPSLETLGLNGYNDLLFDTDLSPLSNIVTLKSLGIEHSKIENMAVLSSLINLESISIDQHHVNTIPNLSHLLNLKQLTIRGDMGGIPYASRSLTDINFLTGTSSLEYVVLSHNNIKDFTPLSQNTGLIILDISSNSIKDEGISWINGLTNIERLDISENGIADFSGIETLLNLEHLEASLNIDIQEDAKEINIEPLSYLTSLKFLDISSKRSTGLIYKEYAVLDISCLSSLINLESLDLYNLSVGDISALSTLTNLKYLNAEEAFVTDISGFENLTNIETVYLSGNYIEFLNHEDNKRALDYLKAKTSNSGFYYSNNLYPQYRIVANKSISMTISDETTIDYDSFVDPVTYLATEEINEDGTVNNIWNVQIANSISRDYTERKTNFVYTTNGSDVFEIFVNTRPYGQGEELKVRALKEGSGIITLYRKGVDSLSTKVEIPITVSAEITGSIKIIGEDENGNEIYNNVENSKALGTHTVLSPTITGYILDDTNTKEVTLTPEDKDQTIIFQFRTPKGVIITKYVDENNNSIAPDAVQTNLILDTHTVTSKEINGYTLNDVTNKTVSLTTDGQIETVTFSYKKDEATPPLILGTITILGKDTKGNEVYKDVETNKSLGIHTVLAPTVPGYILDDTDTKDVALTPTEKDQTITFQFRTPKGNIVTKYVDESNNSIAPDILLSDVAIGEYTVNAKTISGYTLTGAANKSISLTADGQTKTIIFSYTKNKPPVTPEPPTNPPTTPVEPPKEKDPIGVIKGQVRKQGKPFEYADVMALGVDLDPKTTKTDKDGYYEFTNLVFGEYVLILKADDTFVIKMIVVQ